MIPQIIFGLILAAVTILFHSTGVVTVMKLIIRRKRLFPEGIMLSHPISTLIVLVLGLLVLHIISMTIWATAYFVFDAFTDFETCLYFSMTSYSTVGYGDVVPGIQWRLLGPLEGIIGVLMLGLSTGVFVAASHRLLFSDLESDEMSRK
jgi:voltage-gated potassium channel